MVSLEVSKGCWKLGGKCACVHMLLETEERTVHTEQEL